jgi:hypothetical protein
MEETGAAAAVGKAAVDEAGAAAAVRQVAVGETGTAAAVGEGAVDGAGAVAGATAAVLGGEEEEEARAVQEMEEDAAVKAQQGLVSPRKHKRAPTLLERLAALPAKTCKFKPNVNAGKRRGGAKAGVRQLPEGERLLGAEDLGDGDLGGESSEGGMDTAQ